MKSQTSLIILIFGISLSFTIRLFLIINGLDVADVTKLREMGEAVLKGLNPYLIINYNIYPPIALFLEALTISIANYLNVPFHIMTKLWPNLADLLIALLIYKALTGQKVKPLVASLWSLVFILNPISIITSASHGQLDSITSLFILLAVLFLVFKISKKHVFLSGLFIGLGIAVKPNPLMLIPFFLFYDKIDLDQRIGFLLLSIAPTGLTLLPYLLDDFKVLTSLLSYSGVYDISLPAILRGFYYQDNASIWLPLAGQLLQASKLVFVSGAIFLLCLFINSKNLVKAVLATYLLFLTFYFGISVQYLVWILPLAILLRDKMVIPFLTTGILASLGFYLFFGPDIFFGRVLNLAPYQSKFISLYFFGNLSLFLVCLWWFIKIIQAELKGSFNNSSKFRRRLTVATLILFTLSLLPLLLLTTITIQQSL